MNDCAQLRLASVLGDVGQSAFSTGESGRQAQ